MLEINYKTEHWTQNCPMSNEKIGLVIYDQVLMIVAFAHFLFKCVYLHTAIKDATLQAIFILVQVNWIQFYLL